MVCPVYEEKEEKGNRIMMEKDSSSYSPPKRGGGWGPILCNILGTLILLSVIAAFLPLTVPRFMGYDIYEVVSGSMEPEIAVGSVI